MSIEPYNRAERILSGEDLVPTTRLEYFMKEAAQGGGGSSLPSVTADDNGDVLTVVSGSWAKAAPSGVGLHYTASAGFNSGVQTLLTTLITDIVSNNKTFSAANSSNILSADDIAAINLMAETLNVSRVWSAVNQDMTVIRSNVAENAKSISLCIPFYYQLISTEYYSFRLDFTLNNGNITTARVLLLEKSSNQPIA